MTLVAGVALMALAPASANETIGYSYDALGRLVKVVRSGTVNNGASACYAYDKADNRSNVTVSTTSECTPGSGGGDPPPGGVSFSITSNGPVTEGANSVFTITKTGTATTSLTVNYATANGTAVAPGDYASKSGTLTFTTTQNSQPVSVTTIDDSVVENAETFTMSLSSPSGGATITTGTATATINDNDSASPCTGVSFTIASNGSVTEGSTSSFTITKAGSASGSCGVSYATANGSATAGSDYTAVSSSVTFTATETQKTVSVSTIDDSIVESAETFTMSLSNPTGGATLGSPSSATATINDNDSGGSCSGVGFYANNVSATEGSPLVFTVTKTGSTSSSCSVNYSTSDSSAVAPGDYTATSGTLTFTSSQTSKTVSVPTVDDLLPEATEALAFNLSGPTGGATAGTPYNGTIFDNDSGGGCDPFCQLQSVHSDEGGASIDPAESDPSPETLQQPPEATQSPSLSERPGGQQ